MGKKKKKRKVGKPYNVNPYAYAEYDGANYTSGIGKAYLSCHQGNTKLLSCGRGEGGSLFIGGWSRGADHPDDMTVFDLTGVSASKTHYGHYYQIAIEDFDTPSWSLFFWESMAMTIYDELSRGDVLIACTGGHGRSGLFATVISYILRSKRYVTMPDKDVLDSDPLAWIRVVHCHQAVETLSQELCVYETCLAYEDNVRIREQMEELKNKPRHTYEPVSYTNLSEEWDTPEEKETDYWECPICLKEHNSMVAGLMCCNTRDSLRYCPVCFSEHDFAVEAYYCCSNVPL